MIPFDADQITVDASTGIKLLLTDEILSDRAEMLFTHLSDGNVQFFIPDFFIIECANVFWKYTRRKEITHTEACYNLAFMRGLELTNVAHEHYIDTALRLAIQYDISVYDACYVAVAQIMQAPLVTADTRLVQKLGQRKGMVLSLADLEFT